MAEVYESWKNWASGVMQSAVAPFQSSAPGVATTQGSTSFFGTQPEGAGYTSTGGRRVKKKSRKTRKATGRRR
jgi:hypothetical protein